MKYKPFIFVLVLFSCISNAYINNGGGGVSSALTSLNGQTGATQSFANDTNVTITSSNNTHKLGWSGTLSLARGGTSNSLTAANGDILYSDASKVVLLPAGTNGQFLKSSGAGAPSWATAVTAALSSLNSQTGSTQIFSNDANITITSSNNTHALGWLSTLSVARGGTGAGSFTSGSISYSNGTILTQDNANLFWDGTNHRLGVGTSTPSYKLDLYSPNANVGDIIFSAGSVQSNNEMVLQAATGLRVNSGVFLGGLYLGVASIDSKGIVSVDNTSNELQVYATGNHMMLRTGSGGNISILPGGTGSVGIGTSSPGALLDIAGQFRTSGTTATIGTCGVSPSITGTNQSGVFTAGSGILVSCTISFSATLTNAPNACLLSPANATGAAVGTTGAYVSSISTSAFVVTGLNLTSASYYYHCY